MPSAGSAFHCLQATSQALQPMQSVASVKKPIGSCAGGGAAIVMPFERVPGTHVVAGVVPAVAD